MDTLNTTRFDELCAAVKITLPRPAERMTIPAYRHKYGYSVKYPENTIGDVEMDKGDDWHKRAVGMRLKIEYKGREYAFDYWMGTGYFECINPHFPRWEIATNREIYTLRLKEDAITPGSLMHSHLTDYYSADYSFEEFCGEYGYDTDSRRAERIHRAVQEQARQMRRLLGDDLETFLDALQKQDRY